MSAPASSDPSSSASSSSSSSATLTPSSARQLAQDARSTSRTLKSLPPSIRREILTHLADALLEESNVKKILQANTKDVDAATAGTSKKDSGDSASHALSASNYARLSLTLSKLQILSSGLRQLGDASSIADPVNQLRKETLIAEGLTLQQRSVPLGVLLVIFESRPDVLPQLIGLAVLSSNGLILKGGSESAHTLKELYTITTEVITRVTSNRVNGSHLIALVSGRDAITTLLALDDCIDLVIPRGGNALVSHVKSNTRIPVLGHADGVCHIYFDSDYGGQTNLANMIQLVVDSKTDYPAACNALETLLIHEDVLRHTGLSDGENAVKSTVNTLQAAGVTLLVGPRALAHAQSWPQSSPFRTLSPAESLHTEYGDLTMCIELVPDMQTAIDHIHQYGSGHTESILTSNQEIAQTFLNTVDSACVFHNTSTRFADGYRMGLGAEVGISTSRIHARGPVGVEGLMTTKWTMVSTNEKGQPVKPFQTGEKKYLHKQVEINAKL